MLRTIHACGFKYFHFLFNFIAIKAKNIQLLPLMLCIAIKHTAWRPVHCLLNKCD